MPLILASSSATRLRLLTEAGVSVTTAAPRVDEEQIKDALLAEGAPPRDVADKLAEAKAQKISARQSGALVLGCDQVLGLDRETVSKAPDLDTARRILQGLRGRRHVLHSAAVLCRNGKPIWRHVGTVRLTMRNFSDAYLEGYLARNWPAVAGAVGCYHLEGEGVRLFAGIEGDYFTVLGLPLVELLAYLAMAGEIEA